VKGGTGTCWSCSLLISKISHLVFAGNEWRNASDRTTDIVAGIYGAAQRGAQVLSLSLGWRSGQGAPNPNCAGDPNNILCAAIDFVQARDIVVAAAAGNDFSSTVDFPASDARAVGVGGITSTGSFWNDCAAGGQECGSNYSSELVDAPARQVLSTFARGLYYQGPNTVCPGFDSYGLCTGTSMAAPHIAGSAGLLRSINPLLSKENIKSLLSTYVDNPGSWNPLYGTGKPNLATASLAALGKSAGAQVPNRLTPLFSLYSSSAQDSFYTTVPQMATSALLDSVQYAPVGPATPGYAQYPATQCQTPPCPNITPTASVYIFTGDRAPFTGAPPLVPLYRLSYKAPTGSHRDTNYTTVLSGIQALHGVGYELDGVEGYIYQQCTPEPSCIPAGAVKLYRRYNAQRDDFAIFPESELAQMESQGYTSNGGLSQILGYVYPNADSDGDHLINGFEGLLGTDPLRADTDCDGVSDGAEVLGFPVNDPRNGPGCVPPVARFDFTCTQLACSFDAGASTDDVGIAAYSWAFGDGAVGSGVTASRTYAATGAYTVTLTVTDGHGLTSSLSRQVSVVNEAAMPAEGYFSMTPCRILDTRGGTSLQSGTPRTVQVTGACGIPATAKAVSVNVTVLTPSGDGWLNVYPGNQSSSPFPVSAMNFVQAVSQRANNGVFRLATNGAGTLTVVPWISGSLGLAHLLMDVDGYFSEDTAPASGARGPFGYQTVTPCRVADTRSGSPIDGNTTRNLTVQGLCGIPAGAASAAANVTIINPTLASWATLFEAGTSRPAVSFINFPAGSVLGNGARVRLAASTPDVSLFLAEGQVHAVLDVYGYFHSSASSAPLKYRPVTACRLVDTRLSELGAPALAANETRAFKVQGNCGVPVGAKAAALNVTVLGMGSGWLTVSASGSPAPFVSTLNYSSGQGWLGNGVIAPLSTNADDLLIRAVSSGAQVIVDVYGYFQ
jgi:PKD repeat protein